MKNLRILMFGLAAVLFTGSSFAMVKYAKEGKTEQAAQSLMIASLAMATPAVATKNFKSQLGVLGNMGGLTRAEQHLLANLQSTGVDQQTYNDYLSGKLRFVQFNGYVRKMINAASKGVTQILDETSIKQTGITNIHNGKLEKSVNAAVDRIVIGYATTTTASGIQDPANVIYASDIGGFPTGLRNGELIIKVDGARIQDPIPVALCGSQADSQQAFGQFDSFRLNTPILLPQERQITVELDFSNASFGTNNHFVEIFLLGSKTKQRSGN